VTTTTARYYELMGEIIEKLDELVGELGRLRVAVEVLAGDALDRRAEALGGPYDQGDDGR
jgi:hypothetical protein